LTPHEVICKFRLIRCGIFESVNHSGDDISRNVEE
jgi:hypothetical protein